MEIPHCIGMMLALTMIIALWLCLCSLQVNGGRSSGSQRVAMICFALFAG